MAKEQWHRWGQTVVTIVTLVFVCGITYSNISHNTSDINRNTDKVDKVEVCQFKIFYGKLGSAPLIEQCPLNLECKVVHILDLGSNSFVIGSIEEIFVILIRNVQKYKGIDLFFFNSIRSACNDI